MYIKGHLGSLISLSQKPNFYLISIFKTQFKVEVSIIKLENLVAYSLNISVLYLMIFFNNYSIY